jgi:hypothetical protein
VVEADVDSELTLLLVVERPVDNELAVVDVDVDSEERLVETEVTPLWAVLIPVDAEVDSDVTLLLVVDSPVDSEVTPD